MCTQAELQQPLTDRRQECEYVGRHSEQEDRRLALEAKPLDERRVEEVEADGDGHGGLQEACGAQRCNGGDKLKSKRHGLTRSGRPKPTHRRSTSERP